MSIRIFLPLLVSLGLGFLSSACKPRTGDSSSVRDDSGDYYNDGKYHGPNMSAKFCADNPAECLCTLANEYDTENHKPPSDPAAKKEWYRQCIGQEVWYKATAGGARFHAYFAQQRIGVPLDWGWVMHTDDRRNRFDNWGLINDPDCCIPHSGPNANDGTCPNVNGRKITKADTYGWDFCPGDAELLGFVGQPDKDYTKSDPACRISALEQKIGAGIRPNGGDDSNSNRSDSCYLAFGTSTGALGFRKFPNPRFDKERWAKLNEGNVWSWQNYSRRTFPKPSPGYNKPDYSDKGGKQRIEDFSVEPPFLVGETCGSCHISFNPLTPPENPNAPSWDHIRGAVGNIYIHMTEIMGAGTRPGSLEHELFLHSRPGTVDTSAYTNDYVHNPGTFNAIINFDRRPGVISPKVAREVGEPFHRFKEDVTTFRQDETLAFRESTKNVKVPHVLKGGEDSIGAQGAVQRVYINIFSCTETCLANHLDDQRVVFGRGSRQTPFELAQCQRDCPGYNAIEDRMWDVIDFLLHRRPTDLKDAKDPAGIRGGQDGGQIVKAIKEKNDGEWYEDGRRVYAEKCAKCHSSHPGQDADAGTFAGSSVKSIDANTFETMVDRRDEHGVRLDWLGSDVQIPQRVVDTYRCRSLHSNHMTGHLWEAYASDTYRSKERYSGRIDSNLFDYPDEKLNANNLGGRGFYRNISLLSLWAHAPFMHNNALGYEFDHEVFDIDVGSRNDWKKLKPDPSVKGRLKMFEKSIERLLSPLSEREPNKVTRTGADISVPMLPMIPEIPAAFFQGNAEAREQIQSLMNTLRQNYDSDAALLAHVLAVPKGTPVVALHSLKHKEFVWGLLQKMKEQSSQRDKIKAARDYIHKVTGGNLQANGEDLAKNLVSNNLLHCADMIDNRGHEFVDLSDTEKKQLIDFLKTL